ncbi:Chromosome segregation protein sudA [Trichinella pseudospiralis]
MLPRGQPGHQCRDCPSFQQAGTVGCAHGARPLMPPDDSLDGGRHRGKPARTDACRLWLSRSAYAYDSTESRIYSSKLIVSSNSRLRKSLKGR